MGLIDVIFPRSCLSCGRQGRYICDSCIKKVPSPKLVCPECQRPSIDGFTHVKCKKALSLDGIISIWYYQGVVRTALLKLKYAYAREISKEIAEYTRSQLDKYTIALPKDPILIPIPLYFLKENLRGFNQTKLLGEVIARKQGWKFITVLLLRKRFGRSQTELKGEDRKGAEKTILKETAMRELEGVNEKNLKYEIISADRDTVKFSDLETIRKLVLGK